MDARPDKRANIKIKNKKDSTKRFIQSRKSHKRRHYIKLSKGVQASTHILLFKKKSIIFIYLIFSFCFFFWTNTFFNKPKH